MKKIIISVLLLLAAVSVSSSLSGVVYAISGPGDSMWERQTGKEFMRMDKKDKKEATPEAEPTGEERRQMSCVQIKTKLPERAEILKLRKEVHLKVYANLKINLKRRMMARNMSEAAITEALAGLDKLITQFSTDVDALVAKMMDAAKLDCADTTALTTYRENLRLLERTVKADVKAIMDAYISNLKALNSGRKFGRPTGMEATKSPTAVPTNTTTVAPTATAAATVTVTPSPSL